MTNKFLFYADDLVENLSGVSRPTQFPGTFQAGGGYTPFFAVNAPPGLNIGGILVMSTATVVASATCATTAGADALDMVTSGYNVSDAPNADARCRIVDRLGVEEVERLLVAPNAAGPATFLKYPRTAPSSIATGTTTYLGQWVIPCGEPTDAVQLSIKLPTLTQAFASGITSIAVNYVAYVIPSVAPQTIAFVESPLPPYGASSTVPVEQYQPTNITPDILDLVGTAPTVLQTAAIYNTDGVEVVNMLDSTTLQMSQYRLARGGVFERFDLLQHEGKPVQPVRHPSRSLRDADDPVDSGVRCADGGSDRGPRPDPEPARDPKGRNERRWNRGVRSPGRRRRNVPAEGWRAVGRR